MNSFDILRVAAALAVIFHHTFPLNGRPPFKLLGADFGALGVGIFFVVSGYLVTASFRRSNGALAYFVRRSLRIWPGLVISLIFTAVVLGPLVTTLPAADYFSDPQTALYVVRNTLLYPVTYDLPGVFKSNPVDAVNGSLWTLRLEFTCYLGIALLGMAKLLNARVLALAAIGVGALAVLLYVAMPALAGSPVMRLVKVGSLFGFLFLAGAFMAVRGDRGLGWAAAASAGLLFTPVWFLGLPAVALWVGLRPTRRLPADFSYGLYIYAFPIQQVLAGHGALGFWLSLACTLPLAAASWFLVERPALGLKPRARAQDPGPLPAAAAP